MSDNAHTALAVRDLSKRYGAHPVLREVALTVATGSVHGLVGLNGAGKTTLLQCLLGLQPFDTGQVSVLGLSPRRLCQSRGRVAVVFDEPCLHPHFTVDQQLRFAALSMGLKPDPAERDRLISLLGVEPYRHYRLRQLSLGNRRRTAIAQALVGDPALLVLDEPFNGLDAGGVEDLLQLIQTLCRDSGKTFLLSSHQLSYLERVCSHISILHGGQIPVGGALTELLGADSGHQVRLVCGAGQRAGAVIRRLDGVRLLDSDDLPAGEILCELPGLTSGELNRALVEQGVEVLELVRQTRSLEALFHRVTAAEPVGEAANG